MQVTQSLILKMLSLKHAHSLRRTAPSHFRLSSLAVLAFLGNLTTQCALPKKPCHTPLTATAECAPCSFEQWAQKIRTLKERPIELSTLPEKSAYQKNILTLPHFLETIQKAADAIALEIGSDKNWLQKKSVVSSFPEIFKLSRPQVSPTHDVRNFLFKPYAQRLVAPSGTQVFMFGDLHGSVHSLVRDLEKLRDLGYIDNSFKISKKGTYLLFLGDYIDRGIYGTEVIYTIARLKIANPHHVILIRGNHEDYILEPSFRKKHSSEEEKDNTPSFIDELYKKFTLTEKDEVPIFRFYETLPLVLYLGCSKKEHTDYMHCCHGGFELGYDPYPLLHAPQEIQYEAIEKLWRRKNFSSKLTLPSQNAIKCAFSLDLLCNDIRDFVPEAPFYKIEGTDHVAYIGFLWNDLYVDQEKTVGQRGKSFTGWVCGCNLVTDVLSWGNSKTVTLQGMFRAHQHNNETGGPMLNLLCCSKGAARLWNKPIYTFVSAPDSKLDDTGERCFTYDSFVHLTTAPAFKEWKMDHYIQDIGMEVKQWTAVAL